MRIIITGSLGNIGKPLATTLVSQKHDVVVISSNPEKGKEIETLGASAAIGKLQDQDFLQKTFADADAAFLMIPPNFQAPDQIAYYREIASNYTAAVKAGDLKRVVYLSSYGAHLDKNTGFILGAHHAENILNELKDVNITHLRAGYFYYNLYAFTDIIKIQGIIASNFGGNDKLLLVHPDDIAAAAADELLMQQSQNRIRYVGSDLRTATEVAQVLGQAIERPALKWLTFTDAQTKDAMVKRGLPESLAANFTELGAGIHNGKLLENYLSLKLVPEGKVKLEDFAKEFAAEYDKKNGMPNH